MSRELLSFLHAAKRATYAAQGDDASVAPALPDSKQLEFARGPYLYRDIYFGMVQFVGQEVVYLGERALWSMAYAGGLAAGVPAAEAVPIYRALRAALSAVPPELPLRGPRAFELEGLRYRCDVSGHALRFHGAERVTRGEVTLFELQFAGGEISGPDARRVTG